MKETIYIIVEDFQEMDIFLKDGGYSNILWNGEKFLTNYYQARFKSDEVWFNEKYDLILEESKMFVKEWEDKSFIDSEMILDAACWLKTNFNKNNYEIVFVESRHDISDVLEQEENRPLNLNFEEQFNSEYSKVEKEIEELRSKLRLMDKEWDGYQIIKS